MEQARFSNKSVTMMHKVGPGPTIKKIINYKTLCGKFSSVHPDLAAEGITRVEVGEEGLHFTRNNLAGECPSIMQACFHETFFRKKSLMVKKKTMCC